jgi:hypothetical protein
MKLTKTGKIALGVFVILLANGIWQHIQFRKKWNATYEYLKADREEGAEQIWQRNEQQKRSDQANYEEYMKLFTGPDWGYDPEDALPKVGFERWIEKLEEGTASNTIIIGPAFEWNYHVAKLWYDRKLNYASYMKVFIELHPGAEFAGEDYIERAMSKADFVSYIGDLREGAAESVSEVFKSPPGIPSIIDDTSWGHNVARIWEEKKVNYASYVELCESWEYDVKKPLSQEQFEAEDGVVYVQAPTDPAVIVAQQWYDGVREGSLFEDE